MIRRPIFKSHLRVETVPPDLVFFLHESGYKVLQGRLIYLLAPLIDGRNTVAQIARQLKAEATAFDVRCGLLVLEAEGYINDAKDDLPPGLRLLRDSMNIEPRLFLRRLRKTRVSVASIGNISAEPFIAILRSLGIRVGSGGDFAVVLTDDYLRE
ncbi:MAG TPA: adenylate cyclase, partial [Blastocatellia bacterium]|nr:adenylate cyclase [Blastocatellia bacterium]